MQGFHPAIHHFREARVRRNLGDRYARFPNGIEGAAGGEQRHAMGMKGLSQFVVSQQAFQLLGPHRTALLSH
mgnify:CR=1 FL=1